MDMRFQSILGVVLLICCGSPVAGADPGHNGDEECTWENKCLIIAKVVNVGIDRGATKFQGCQNYLTLAPKMTLAGRFDCAGAIQIKMPVVLGPFGGPLDRPPSVGEVVVALVELCDDGYFVPGRTTTYMPESLPIASIWGYHDEALFKIVSTVGERRMRGARKDQEQQADCTAWVTSAYPKYSKHIKPLLDKSFEARSIVFARIKSVEHPDQKGERQVTLRLIGTVAGRLDPALIGEAKVSIPAKLVDGRELPWRDAEMFVVVEERGDRIVLAEGGLDYMPTDWALCPVKTRPEETCEQILANVRHKFSSKRDE